MIAEVWARLRRDTRARIGLAVVAMLVLLAILAPLLARHDPIRGDLLRQLEPPSTEHWMGTDVQGRDVWARLVYGARISLAVGLISQSIALAIGLLPWPHRRVFRAVGRRSRYAPRRRHTGLPDAAAAHRDGRGAPAPR